MEQIIFKGKKYQRESENLGGDVMSIKWFSIEKDGSKEVYDSDLLNELESIHESLIIESISPKPFFI